MRLSFFTSCSFSLLSLTSYFLTIFWHKISFLKNEAYKDFSKYSNIRILKGTLLICGFNLKLPRQPGSPKFPSSNLFNPLFTPFLYSCHILCTDALLFNLQLSFDFNRNLLVWMTDKTHHQATHHNTKVSLVGFYAVGFISRVSSYVRSLVSSFVRSFFITYATSARMILTFI